VAPLVLRSKHTTALVAVLLMGCATGPAQRSTRGRAAPTRATAPPATTARAQPPGAPEAPRPALRDDDGPLTAKIHDDTPASRAAALRLTEQARGLIASGAEPRAIELLERAVAIDARVPYAYYFLAEAHYAAGRPALARSFLDRAAQLLAGQPYWLGRVYALRGRVCEDEGRRGDARTAYQRALAVWPNNAVAAAGLARLDAGALH